MRLAVAALCLLLAGGATTDASAQAPGTDYFRGKEVRILVGSAPGGGYDSYARLAASSLQRHLPGNPSVLVQNMPGGGGLNVVNYIAQKAPRDGTVIAITNRNLTVAPVLGLVEASTVQYDPSELVWIANLNSDVSFIIVRAGIGIETVEDLRRREVIVGSSGATDNNGLFPHIANSLIGTRFKLVTGYHSSNDLSLALDRGEIDGIAGYSWTTLKVSRPDWLRDGKVVLLLQLGLTSLPGYERVPLMLDLVKGDREHRALELISTLLSLGRPFFAPPQIPPPAAASLRAGFAAMTQDPAFIALAEREKFDVTFMPGEELQQTVRRLNAVDREVAAMARRAMQQGSAEAEKPALR